MNYMICKWMGNENNAAVKAVVDIIKPFAELGGKVINIWNHNKKYIRNIEVVTQYKKMKKMMTSEDNVVVMYPLYCIAPYYYDEYLKLPHKKMIAFVQDIESYRYYPNDRDKLEKELEVLRKFDVIIAHNRSMIQFLHNHNVNAEFVDWEVCDYLINKKEEAIEIEKPFSLCYVGDIKRSEFLRANSEKFTTQINLYGKMERELLLTPQLRYKGIYNPDSHEVQLDGAFGLVWEGNSLDTCQGNFGNYMLINNPNRLSLYLANNIPVITWKKAGLANFIDFNGVGFTVNSLTEIDEILSKMTIDEYEIILEKTKVVGKKMREGYYGMQALKKALQ